MKLWGRREETRHSRNPYDIADSGLRGRHRKIFSEFRASCRIGATFARPAPFSHVPWEPRWRDTDLRLYRTPAEGGGVPSIGLFTSTLTENQIIAFIFGITICFVLLIIGEDIVLFNAPNWLFPIFSYLGLGAHYSSILRGVLDSRDIIYYLSLIGFFLYLSTLSVESRKWR